MPQRACDYDLGVAAAAGAAQHRVGSLPFQRPRPAARHAACAYELPFCPQLPRLYGDMIVEWLGADPGGCGWSPDRDRQLPGVWEAFVAALEASPPAHRIVKLQVTGPVTLAIALERGAGRGRGQADAVDLAAEIATWLAASAASQTDALAELGFDVVLIIDEPGVATAGLVLATSRSGTRCVESALPGVCTSAVRSRGRWSTPQSPTCCRSTACDKPPRTRRSRR